MDGIDKAGSVTSAATLRPATVAAPAAPTATPAVQTRQAEDASAAQAFALLADAAPVDSKKVEAIKSLIESGAYPIDAHAIAAKMVALDFPASGDSADA